MNKVILIGNLTKDVERRTTTNGKSVATFSIAVGRRYKQEGQPEADFMNIVVWGASADNCAKYLNKGKKVAVVGSIQNRSYDATDGSKRYITEIIADEVEFLSPKNENGSNVAQNGSQEILEPVEEDELPF